MNFLANLIDKAVISPNYTDVHKICSGKKIVVYGAGGGYDTLSVFILDKYGYPPVLVIDKKFTGESKYKGCLALPPEKEAAQIKQLANDPSHLVVISIGHKSLQDEIRRDLTNLGFKNIIWAFDIYEYHLSHTTAEIYEQGVQYYKDNFNAIESAYKLFTDETSKQVFTELLKTHLTRSLCKIPSSPLSEQYFPSDVPLLKNYSRLINCGSYNGDTVKQLMQKKGKIESLACFEPDEINYRALTTFLSSKSSEIADSVVAFPCGVFSKTTKLRFSGNNTVNSTLDEKGEEVIQCVSIDEALPGFKPTFINMDVESAEPAAVEGAKTMIQQFKPDLAICVYHSPNHLWEIPLQIKEYHTDYQFYLRNYTGYPAETVVYATSSKS